MALLLVLLLAVVSQALKPPTYYNRCVVADVDDNDLELKLSLDNGAWQDIIDMYMSKTRKWIGGQLIEDTNKWGFNFNPSSIVVVNATDESLQTSLWKIGNNTDYWFNVPDGVCYMNVTVFGIQEHTF